ncbi:DUF2155 domain-containing protein [Brevundimonas sp.]|uniref:DUF2155 domain-containing protein n=1 Tax=Brevundimonas sp. TaxID=1871086 RepID=UPI0035670447
MNRKGPIVAGAAAMALLASGAVVASALNDLPQDAVPIPNPTAGLNTQPATPPEPAPEAAPAPAAPIAITPVGPTIPAAVDPVVGDDAVVAEEDAGVAEKAVVKAEAPVAPSRRQRGRVAIIEAVDKITGVPMRFEVEVDGRPVRFQRSLIIKARACEVSASDEQVGDAIAYLEVSVQPRGVIRAAEPRQIFRGWMFASSPAVSGLQHPIYDAWVVGCKA